MPQSPHFIPQEREESLTAKSLSPLAKTTLLGSPIFKIYGQNFCFSEVLFLVKITVNHVDFVHFAHSPHELREIHYKIHPH